MNKQIKKYLFPIFIILILVNIYYAFLEQKFKNQKPQEQTIYKDTTPEDFYKQVEKTREKAEKNTSKIDWDKLPLPYKTKDYEIQKPRVDFVLEVKITQQAFPSKTQEVLDWLKQNGIKDPDSLNIRWILVDKID